MKTFHADPALKTTLIKRALEHEEADRVVQGHFWIGIDDPARGYGGCAVGCLSTSVAEMKMAVERDETDMFLILEKEFGLSEKLCDLAEEIFEGYHCADFADGGYRTFPRRFAEAVPIGVVLDEAAYQRLVEQPHWGDVEGAPRPYGGSHGYRRSGAWSEVARDFLSWLSSMSSARELPQAKVGS